MFKRIYVLQCGESYKIGVSRDTMTRVKTLQCGNPLGIELVYESDYIKNAYWVESVLHKRFDGQRIKGEWFYIKDIQDIIDIVSKESDSAPTEGTEGEKSKTERVEIDMDFFFPFLKELAPEGLNAETERLKKENADLEKFLKNVIGGNTPNIYTNLIYRTLFDKTAKELEQEYGVKPRENLRDFFSGVELEKVQSMEMLISSLIGCGWGYEQIKEFVREQSAKMIAS